MTAGPDVRTTAARVRSLAAALAAGLVVSLAGAVSATAAPTAPDGAAAVDPRVTQEVAGGATTDAWLVLDARADLGAASQIEDRDARGQAVVDALQSTARDSQAAALEELVAEGVAHQSFWVSNRILVRDVDSELTARLADLPGVERITPTTELALVEPAAATDEARVDAVEWGIAAINADDVWSEYGNHGEGLLVANIDSGVQFDHPALATRYRGWSTGGVDHDYSWYDPSRTCSTDGSVPCDNNGHGTHTMGTMVGADGANQVGVAPGARWIAAKGCETNGCSDASLLASGQWTLAPTDTSGANPDVSKRPDIINNSWGGANGGAEDPWYDEIVQAWTASGQFGVFSNGNAGPGCDTAGSPADSVHSYAVGNFTSAGAIASTSSRGPGADGQVRPSISAPGTSVRSSVPGDSYASYSGTSMAAPHVAGSVALLWSIAPALAGDIEGTRTLLDTTALDVSDLTCGGTATDNNVWGEGKLDVLAAAHQAPVGDTGTLAGTVSDAATGDPVAGATVVVDGAVDRTLTTAADGTYTALLPVGEYEVSATAFGYDEDSASATVLVDETTTVDLALAGVDRHTVSGTVTDPRGAPVVGAVVQIEPTPLDPVTTGADGAFSFASVPEGGYTVTATPTGSCATGDSETVVVDGDETVALTTTDRVDAYGYYCYTTAGSYQQVGTALALTGDEAFTTVPLPFPVVFYGQEHRSVFVSTNGHLNFLSGITAYGNVQLPAPAAPNAAVYPFWDDLQVDASSGVYTGTATVGGRQAFVVEWRNVKIFGQDLRIDAEAMVFADGSVRTAYRGIDAANVRERGSSATVGIENATGTVATVFSYNTASLSDGVSVVFELPPSGVVAGTVTDTNDGAPVAGAAVALTRADGSVARQTTTGADGRYLLQVAEGTYTLTVTRTNYVTESRQVVVETDERLVADFSLETARGSVAPGSLEWLLPQGVARTADLTLTNDGSAPMAFAVGESGGGAVGAASAATGARVTASQRAERSEDALSARVALTAAQRKAADAVVAAPGDVIGQWPATGLAVAWGVGEGADGTVWVSDPETVDNTEFAADGTATGRNHPASWAGTWNGDMSYDTREGLMCQVNVGGDNGIHCWDEQTGEVGYTLTGPGWSDTSQRGLAYVAADDTFYVGGWNSEEIFHVAGTSHATPGAVLDSCTPDEPSIAGLGWSDAAGVLWMVGSSADNTVYRLDPDTCETLGTTAFPETTEYAGAGLEIDSAGDLWLASLESGTVYRLDSGLPEVVDVPWLSVDPAEGSGAGGDEHDARGHGRHHRPGGRGVPGRPGDRDHERAPAAAGGAGGAGGLGRTGRRSTPAARRTPTRPGSAGWPTGGTRPGRTAGSARPRWCGRPAPRPRSTARRRTRSTATSGRGWTPTGSTRCRPAPTR